MKAEFKSFGLILAICAGLSFVLAMLNGGTLASFISLGSVVGAGTLLLGCWRLLNRPSRVIEHLHMTQRIEHLEAARSGHQLPEKGIVYMFLSSGPLAFAGLTWLVGLQAIRYGFAVTL